MDNWEATQHKQDALEKGGISSSGLEGRNKASSAPSGSKARITPLMVFPGKKGSQRDSLKKSQRKLSGVVQIRCAQSRGTCKVRRWKKGLRGA